MKTARRGPKLLTAEQIEAWGHKYCRDKLKDVELPTWRPCWVHMEAGSDVDVMTGDDHHLIATFNRDALKRDLSAEHYAIFEALFGELMVQSQVAIYAVNVAAVELGINKKRVDGAQKRGKERKREAADANAELLEKAKQIRSEKGSIPNTVLAELIVDREGGSKEVIRKKLGKLLRK